MAVGIEEVLLNVNGQDKIHFVLAEDGLHLTEVGYFPTLEDALFSEEFCITKALESEAERLADEEAMNNPYT